MLLGTKALEQNVDGIACGLPAWGQLFLTPFGSLRESLWTPRSLAIHSASSQVAPGPEACWLGWMVRLRVPWRGARGLCLAHWELALARAGKSCSHGALGRDSDSPHVHPLCVLFTLWAVGVSWWTAVQEALRCLGVGVCVLVSTPFLLLAPLALGAGNLQGASGGYVDRPFPRG